MGSSPEHISPGSLVDGRYRVEGALGEGGMGVVYAVVDVETGAPFAMKVVGEAEDPEHARRLVREGRVLMTIRSDHVVRVHDVGSIDDRVPFIVMDRLVGSSLKAHIDDMSFDERAVADLMIQACEGLARAHAEGVIHRDVKPSNLFIVGGSAPQLKVIDFGISRVAFPAGSEGSTRLTRSRSLLGSPWYASPEQLTKPSEVDERADVWSLGVTMYEALTSHLPFDGASLAELLVAVMSKPPRPFGSPAPVSPRMQAIIAKCLERSLEQRFRCMSDLARALAECASPRWAAFALDVRPTSLVRSGTAERHPVRLRGPDDRTLTTDRALGTPESAAWPPPFATTTVPFATATEPFATATVPFATTTEPFATATVPFATTTVPFATATLPLVTPSGSASVPSSSQASASPSAAVRTRPSRSARAFALPIVSLVLVLGVIAVVARGKAPGEPTSQAITTDTALPSGSASSDRLTSPSATTAASDPNVAAELQLVADGGPTPIPSVTVPRKGSTERPGPARSSKPRQAPSGSELEESPYR